jgi:hypothetical protein
MDDSAATLAKVRQIVAQRLESLQRSGVEQLRCPPTPVGRAAPIDTPASSHSIADESSASVGLLASPPPSVPLSSTSQSSMPRSASAAISSLTLSQPYPTDVPDATAGRQQLLEELNNQVRACQLCRELACTRKQTVFGIGNAKPRVVFFGEAPGADEDRQGEPFVGRAGQLLTKIIEACGWQRSDVYIMNVLKCRPPDNRNPSAKKYVWDDMQMLLKEMGLPVPGRGGT